MSDLEALLAAHQATLEVLANCGVVAVGATAADDADDDDNMEAAAAAANGDAEVAASPQLMAAIAQSVVPLVSWMLNVAADIFL